uniref:Glycerol-3-phosphate acyltransferase 3 n=1 Tax=Saribus rotundifolius TaxID=674215 RepID=A0A346RPG2_9LILI|nr:glycerol-3-phosphate acyltransferase 3 [Saribus rotundifolius]
MATASHGEEEKRSIACEFEGALLISRRLFAYFMLVALEAGGPIRALTLLLIFPLLWLLELIGLERMALQLMIFVSTAGLRVDDLKVVAKAILPRFYLEDLRQRAYQVFSSYEGKKYVVTCIPRIMVEPFLKEFLDVDYVIGTELKMFKDCSVGLVASPGVMLGARRLEAVLSVVEDGEVISVGLGSAPRDKTFMLLYRELYPIPPEENSSPLRRKDYPKPLIFHDGRLVAHPTPLAFLAVILWLPLGVLLAISRILVGIILPYKMALVGSAVTGLRIRAHFPTAQHAVNTPAAVGAPNRRGTVYVCNHRTLLDPVIVSTAIQRKVTAVTYSLSRFSEVISPIPTIRLTRDRFKDGAMMRSLLNHGDLVVCPEGTTCREPYLLRFSPLFAEIADDIIPVAVAVEGSMFYGTTVRGHKWLDSFFFLMNPRPCYQLHFLESITRDQRSSYEIANGIQRLIGRAIGFECTKFTRKDKYQMLAGHDGADTRR